MSKYDIIIAGSGLGGLECAAILSKEGYNVCVLEKNVLFGGCLQTYKRKGHLLDTGIHYIGSLDDGQIMNQYFKYFGIIDKLKMKRLDTDSFDTIFYKNKIYNYAVGHDNFADTLSNSFPHERENLKSYVSALKEVGRLIDIDTLKKGIIAQNGMKYFYASAANTIADTVNDETLKNVLAATSMLYGGIENMSTFYHHAMINNSYIESPYRFMDGTMQIADRLIEVIRTNGGTVLNNKEITRLIVTDNEVTAAEVNNEEIFEADHFISNIHPKRTLEILDKSRYIKNAYISRINALPNSFGIFTLYLVMKPNTYPYINSNYYVHGTDNVWYNHDSSRNKVNNALLCFQCNNNSNYTDVISVMSCMYMSELKEWEHTSVGKRGNDYITFKKDYSNKLLEFLKTKGFDFTDKVESMYTTTPLSYRDYTGTPYGSAYGIIKDYKFPEIGFISTKTKLKNLYFTGQNMNVHGALGVTLTAMFTCSDFVGQEYLAKKVGNA
ncbi:NAD(P)/FAD-dependent oxidoreductase [Dysgonomonas sp. Marseille-P4677]|uniref:phytoene desaturase family protein n=1 Tax=Dysgonomonas sp. Marseille-P4677 TaxID=2364790 RepID=UPI00191186E4|nr:NAD(P)-binding protein [Dysgonomonas sp. Marseille-P4677]MBK5720106.1 NAD(P)/FAD-dependent oxidoreductase [Dysgonomonas sp. Marseille-P4677]